MIYCAKKVSLIVLFIKHIHKIVPSYMFYYYFLIF